jgi:hypothetical protein
MCELMSLTQGRPAHLHGPQHAPHGVRDELGGGRQLVVLLAAHLHHVAPLALKELQADKGSANCGRYLPANLLLPQNGH